MQTREMFKSGKWRLVAGAATLSALGIGGIALADQSAARTPEAITLRDQVSSGDDTVSTLLSDLRPTGGSFGGDLDSPFDDSNTDDAGASVTGDTPVDLDTLTGDSGDDVASPVDEQSSSLVEPNDSADSSLGS